MTGEQEHFLDRADRAMRSAYVLLDDGDVEAALNRAYYATFYCATAALRGAEDAPRTHSGTHALFGQRFVRPGLLEPSIGKLMTRLFDLRQRADYGAISIFDTRAAADALADAEAFVAAVRPLVTAP